MTLMRNMVVAGRFDNYNVIKDLKKGGGMAEIWLATNSRNQEVIIKCPKIVGDGNDDLRVQKLKVEAEILRDLSNPGHPNIVKYIDESIRGSSFYLVIEKINPTTLKDVVTRNPVDEKITVSFIGKILMAIGYIHSKNVIHRDIKPGNILLDSRGDPVLIDFGAAKRGWVQMKSTNETIIGTPGWSCPHQFQGQLETSCDIYSVGTVMFYMLTGKEPKLFMDSASNLTKKPNELNPAISYTVSELVKNAVDPHHRMFSTAGDMISFMQMGTPTPFGRPHIILQGMRFELQDETDIGRAHNVCDNNCNTVGFRSPPKIAVKETAQNIFISKHHVRIWKDRQGYYWFQDLRSKNGTAIFAKGSYRPLSPGQKEMLLDNSSVALCYNPTKGPYITFTFHER